MSSSFAADLKRFAAEAAAAKRLELKKAKEAESAARTEALRVQKLEKARARQENRERDAEARRQRREAEAATKAEQKRIEAERRLAEMAERRRLEAEERARRRELRKSQLCSEIYRALAVAAWDGVQEVVVDPDAFDFRAELSELGIAVSRRSKLARLFTDGLKELLRAVHQFLKVSDKAGDTEVSEKLRSLSERIQKSGQPKLAVQISKLSWQVVQQSALRVELAMKDHQKLLYIVDGQKQAIVALEVDTSKLKAQLADAVATQKRRDAQILPVVHRIKTHLDDIASSYQAQLPQGLQPQQSLSYETRAAALRVAYGRFIHDIDFEKFSALEIINLMRRANGHEPIANFYPKLDEDQGSFDRRDASDASAEALSRRLQQKSNALSSAKAKLAATRDELSRVKNYIRTIKDNHGKALSFHEVCIRFEELISRSLEGVDVGQLRFERDQYIGPTMAYLDSEVPAPDVRTVNAYEELRWLATEDGRVFSGYLDVVLSELAKDGARSTELSFVEGDGESRVAVGKVALVCKIGSPLMGLLFSERGLAVNKKPGAEPRETLFRLKW